MMKSSSLLLRCSADTTGYCTAPNRLSGAPT